MGDFANRIAQRALSVETKCLDVVAGCALVAHTEFKVGGPITGAPGQPVDSGNLRNSIQLEQLSDTVWESSTPVEYAAEIEYNERNATLRSSVGGFHSRELVVAGWPRIIEHVVRAQTQGTQGGGDA